jgi:hypothetical protein
MCCFATLTMFLLLQGKPAFAADNQVVLIFGGDVEWSLNGRPPTVRYRVADPTPYGEIVYGRRDVRDQVTGDWPPIPYTDQGESGAYLKSLGLKGPSDASTGESLSYPLPGSEEYTKDYSSDDALLNYPLRRLAGHGQLRGRSVRSQPPGWLEPDTGEVRDLDAGGGNWFGQSRQQSHL